jgi:VanZ-like protein
MLLIPGEVNRERHWFEFHNLDKIVHFLIFVVLGFCDRLAFFKQKKRFFVVVMFIYALFTEVAQGLMNMGRTMDFYDLIADMMGAGFGCFLFWQILSYIEKRK